MVVVGVGLRVGVPAVDGVPSGDGGLRYASNGWQVAANTFSGLLEGREQAMYVPVQAFPSCYLIQPCSATAAGE